MSEPHKIKPTNRIWIDTETTGLDPSKHEMLEVAVVTETVLTDGSGSIINGWCAKIAPERIDVKGFLASDPPSDWGEGRYWRL